jgi:phage recombination protein Bet
VKTTTTNNNHNNTMNETTELAIAATLEKRGIDESLWSAIKSSIFPGASDESALLAYDYCSARGLDIMKKPCHIVPMNVKDAKTGRYGWRDVIMSGIVEHRITAMRTGEYAGQDAPIFGPMVDVDFGGITHTVPEFCTVTVYRITRGERGPHPHTEYFEEACGTTKDGSLNSMWKRRKRGQLAKCAEAGALRKGFPEELGGLITVDEATPELRDITPPKKQPKIEPFKKKQEVIEEQAQEEAPQEPIIADNPPKTEDLDRIATITKVDGTKGENCTRYAISMDIGGKSIGTFTFSHRIAKDAQDNTDKASNVCIRYNKDKGTSELLSVSTLATSSKGDLPL